MKWLLICAALICGLLAAAMALPSGLNGLTGASKDAAGTVDIAAVVAVPEKIRDIASNADNGCGGSDESSGGSSEESSEGSCEDSKESNATDKKKGKNKNKAAADAKKDKAAKAGKAEKTGGKKDDKECDKKSA